MARYCSLESVPIVNTSSKDEINGADFPGHSSSRPHRVPTSWFSPFIRCLSDCIVNAYLCWTLLPIVSLDLIFKLLGPTGSKEDPEPNGITNCASARNRSLVRTIVFALHPRLALLAYTFAGDDYIRFHDPETSRRLWRSPLEDEKVSADTTKTERIPSCMQFSSTNHLAIGYSDGTVLLLRDRFGTLVKSTRQGRSNMHNFITDRSTVALLPIARRDIYTKLVGDVTNLQFSPRVIGVDGSSGWLAIGTGKSGVWLWNLRTSQATRIVASSGVNLGCLVWTSPWSQVEEEPSTSIRSSFPVSYSSTLESGSLQDSPIQPPNSQFQSMTAHALGNAFGREAFDDLISLKEYYMQPTPRFLAHSSPLHSRSTNSRSSSSESPYFNKCSNAVDMEGRTLLTVGSKDGTISLVRVFHTNSILRIEAAFEFSAEDIASQATHDDAVDCVAAGSITNLIVVPALVSTGAVSSRSYAILTTASADQSSQIHIFNVNVPSEGNRCDTALSGPIQIYHRASYLISKAAKYLTSTALPRWYPKFPRVGSATGDWSPTSLSRACANYSGAQHICFNTETYSPTAPSARIISMAAAPNNMRLLVTAVHTDITCLGKCISFQLCASSLLEEKTILTDRLDIEPMQMSTLPQQQSFEMLSRSRYTAMLSPSELARIRREQRRRTYSSAFIQSPVTIQDHALFGMERRYGRVAFGTDGNGDTIGAYAYEPASFLDLGPAVGLFILNP